MNATLRPLLEIRDLTITPVTGGRAVVDNISLSVAKGEVLALIGESGSGKTTLALTALGRVRPGLTLRRGQVNLGGCDMLSASASES